MRKIVSFLMLAVFLIAPVSAASSSGSDVEYVQKAGFWTWAAGKGKPLNGIIGHTFGAVCPNSEDGYHHASSYERPIGNWTQESGYYKCICDLCGAKFDAYEKDLQQSYDAQVAELPAPSYGSNGELRWRLNVHSIRGIYGSVSSVQCGATYSAVFSSLSMTSSFYYRTCAGSLDGFVAPVSGVYTLYTYYISDFDSVFLPAASNDNYYYFSGSYPISISTTRPVMGILNQFSSVSFLEGDKIVDSTSEFYFGSRDTSAVCNITGYWELSCVPVTLPNGDTYNINSRPTSITGDYGIIGDNGQIIKVEGDKIVNETNNTYYNPSTGQTVPITDWSYNYEDRSYTVTTETGDTVTITYGDENVVIKEGDTTYNIYYLVDGSGSENPGTCNHQWAETGTTPATCTVPGSRTLTCSLCGETKTEIIPAPGHKWVIRQTVNTQYDEEGNKTQDGYTIFECSVCGEQYKSTDGGAPPGGNTGTGSGSSGGVFSGIFGLLVDFLGFFWNTFRDFVGEGVKGFLTALMDGTSSIFGLLNPFNWGG